MIKTIPLQPTKGTLAVVLNYEVNASVTVKDASGRLVAKAEASGAQAEFQLQRGRAYQVEVSHPSYIGSSGKTKALGATEIVQLKLTPQFATLRMRDLPLNSQVFIDNELRATADKNGAVVISNLNPGDHSILVRHPQYNDYFYNLTKLEAGEEVSYPRLPLSRVARIAIRGTPGAMVFIDGAMLGRVNPDGTVRINYELTEPGERIISFELPGYQTLSKREMLTPGVHTLEVKLDPVITSAGVSDFFESLSLWNAPPTWRIISAGPNKKLEVRGERLGLLADKTYRDFQVNFSLWLDDGKGASWVVRADQGGRSYYLFHLSGPSSTAYTPRRFYTFLINDGAAPVEVSTPVPVIPDLNNKTPYTINIIVENNRIRHKITSNDTGVTDDLGSWTDTSINKDKFLYGTFGFRSLAGEMFSVDDLAVSLELPKEP